MRGGGHGKDLLNVYGHVRDIIVLNFKLFHRNVPALMT